MKWEQLKTILWLRWRLTHTQWARSRPAGLVVAIIVGVVMISLTVLGFGASFLVGLAGLREATPEVIRWIWFGITVVFLFFWLIGLVAELQRSESIDLQRLMHLPVALGQVFTMNYLASHLTLSIVLAVPVMIGMALGLAIARGPSMILLAPLGISMVLMITAWTYCLRGWLAAMMTNPRRRRAIIMGITLVFVLLGQGPNLYFNVVKRWDNGSSAGHKSRSRFQNQNSMKYLNQLVAAQKFIPPLWVPVGAYGVAHGNVLPALAGTLGCLAIGAAGLHRAYRSTLRFYHGVSGK